ncbi:uncharacterized protein LOC117477577 [Trematomus bernacchii]|uniref:uncharacterized protein LOC117477577 n=1 Tax=Trematomus bernacchii TaxID=40690 RepID=UPI00146B11C7|nr:uncharacterized protein LOC117477577 [Trematomus bernacchii]
MDKNANSTNFIFTMPGTDQHFKPLSKYSRMVACEQKTDVNDPRKSESNPFVNFEFELINNSDKRKVEYSCIGDSYETPAKKTCIQNDLSPDLGYFSPPSRADSVSPFSTSFAVLLNDTKDVSKEKIETVSSPLQLEQVEGKPLSLGETGVDNGTVLHRLTCEGADSKQTVVQDEGHVECLEGEVENAWNIGSPIFNSSMFQATPAGEESTLDTSYEPSLPLQVQVKSVVVNPNRRTETAAPTLGKRVIVPIKWSPEDNRVYAPAVSSASTQRPVVFVTKGDSEREKRLYVHSVTRHMKEHPGANKDAMSELMTLMNSVADQSPGADGKQWQHPSNLTRRNYQRRLGRETPKMTLHEWKTKITPTHKRFAKVPKTFKRSSFS